MTGLRKWRKVARSYILLTFALEVGATIATLALIMFVTLRGGGVSFDQRLSVIGTFGVCVVVIWAIRDARGRRRPKSAERPGQEVD